MKRPLASLSLLGLLAAGIACAAERPIASFEDPAGDDDGNGVLVYPQRQDFQSGDLDLLSLRILRSEEGYIFQAAFRNPIRDPATVIADIGGEKLAEFARHGFYAFNLDIYLDQDRIAGSGNTYTLPGRHVDIDPANAWEKAVILTPRPELMRQQLIDAVAESEGARDREAVARRIDAIICFPAQVKVRGRTVSFVVPAAFLGAAGSEERWSMVAFVTGAKTGTESGFNLLRSPGAALDRVRLEQLPLGVMQPAPGRPRDTFGYSGTADPEPIVDLLAPGKKQRDLLQGTALAGIAWGSAGTVAAAPVAGNAQPVTGLVTAPPSKPEPPARPADAPPDSVAARLRTLQKLLDEKLISREEYEQLRSKILSELTR